MLAETLSSLPAAMVAGVMLVAMAIMLVQCVCGKKNSRSLDTDNTADGCNHSPALEMDMQKVQCQETNGIHLDIETGVTPLANSTHVQNGNLHSKGNCADNTKADRHSGASTGSSPRPATLSRELPDIPVNNRSLTLPSDNRGAHSMIIDNHSRIASPTLDNHQRVTMHSTHLHTQLPEIPKSAMVAENRSPGTSPLVTRQQVGSVGSASRLRPNSRNSSGLDDYDHIEEMAKKKSRPRSDYDHVVLEDGEKRVKLSKDKLHENDYAEVKGNKYPSTQEVTVISISKPSSTSPKMSTSSTRISRTDPLPSVSSLDDPYNRIKGDDPPYNKIREDNSFKFKSEDPPYNKIKDDTIKSDDPYNTVKDDDPYNKVKVDIDLLDDLDPYDAVIEGGSNSQRSSSRKKTERESFSFKNAISDPYSLVDEERNVSNQTDPYARVVDMDTEIDPYNKVIEENDVTENILPEYGEDDYATVNKAGEVEYAKVNKQTNENRRTVSTENLILQPSVHGSPRREITNSREHLPKDEYAKVVKVNRSSGANGGTSVGMSGAKMGGASRGAEGGIGVNRGASGGAEGGMRDTGVVRIGVNNAHTPPEPPRSYNDDGGVNDDDGADADHYNTVSLVRENSVNGDQADKKKEPPYNKLSVRESLASMNARVASNTYEYVSEVDNLYATVDGSSGDGVVRPKTTSTTTATAQLRESQTYAEIDAPAPPSLDSLHETAKHHLDEIRRKNDKLDYYNLDKNLGQGQSGGQGPAVKGHSRTSSDHTQIRTGSNDMTSSMEGRVMSASFEGRVMSGSFEGRVPIATEENVDLDCDPGYQAMQEEKISDVNSDFDPNYETVEEAKSKAKYEEINGARPKKIRPHIYEVPDEKRKYEVVRDKETVTEDGKIRAHVYEEVTVTGEARRLRQKVLSQHTYEEVPEVKGEGQRSNKGEDSEKKKKSHSRTSSGDWLFGKKKSGDDKGKDGKKKDGKDGKK